MSETPAATAVATQATPAKPCNGTRIGVSNYTKRETIDILLVIDHVLPIGNEEWKQVQALAITIFLKR